MDGIKSSPPLRCIRPSRPAAAHQFALNPQPINAVAIYFSRRGAPMYAHEKVTLSTVAENIAGLNGYRYVGAFDANQHSTGDVFFVPDDTLIFDEARSLGIHSPRQLYGAVVPFPFTKTKVITHRLINTHAARPYGWSAAFAENVSNAVLPGYAVFDADGARTAAMRLLSQGSVRVKQPLGDGGRGQTVVSTVTELNAFLETLLPETIALNGLVLETNLRRVTTRSVGHTMVGDRAIAYHGTQWPVTNNHGLSVYGGSHLICVRGGWAELETLPLDSKARLAITQARIYDCNAAQYPGFFASRRNYDVGQGVDGRGQWQSGVFEASWRAGGASTAELAALKAFAQDPALQVVEATSVKRFGRPRKPPAGALVHFQGNDPEEGPLVRYTVLTRSLRHVAMKPGSGRLQG